AGSAPAAGPLPWHFDRAARASGPGSAGARESLQARDGPASGAGDPRSLRLNLIYLPHLIPAPRNGGNDSHATITPGGAVTASAGAALRAVSVLRPRRPTPWPLPPSASSQRRDRLPWDEAIEFSADSQGKVLDSQRSVSSSFC